MSHIYQFDTSMRLLEKVLDLRSQNQEVIASNLANAETPGYSARSFTFEGELHNALQQSQGQTQGSLRPVPTQSNHIPLATNSFEQVSGRIETHKDQTGIGDKNSVSVDKEMIKLSENEILYETAVTMLNKKIAMLKYSVNGGA